jgi:hypothetical protein
LAWRFPGSACSTSQTSDPAALTARSLPTDLHGLVRLQHASPLPHRAHPIRTIAGTLSMSERTLQR